MERTPCWRWPCRHDFQPADGVARRVGVDRGERAVVTRVHGLQHVERFLAADFADDDAVGPHTQAVDQQLALPHRAVAFEVGGPGFQTRHVRLLQLQFGRVFDGDDALLARDEAGERVEQGGFAGAGSARDDDVQARLHARLPAVPSCRASWQLALYQIVRHQLIGRRNGGWRAAAHPRPAAE